MQRRSYIILGALGVTALTALASNHREAPITALDHKADITDLFAFVSYDRHQIPGQTPERVTLIMNVDPLLEPANGPTLFPFDPDIRYEINVDNDHDAIPDIAFRWRFETTYQLPDVYTAVAGVGDFGATNPTTGVLVVPPRITSFSSLGLNQRQTYRVDMVNLQTGVVTPIVDPMGGNFFAVPGNAGPRTMDYEALYRKGTYELDSGISLFAGTIDDPFFIDLGAAFDTANFRTLASGVPGVLTDMEDASPINLASDTISGFAVNTLIIEVPISMLTSTGMVEAANSPAATIGVYGTTSRQRRTIRRAPMDATHSGPWSQIQRVGNPLINELLIGIGSKNRFSMDLPVNDAQFAGFFLDPPIVKIFEALYGGALAVPSAPRTDLLPLVTYAPPIAGASTPSGPIADMLRLNTGVSATPLLMQSRLGLLAGDGAGFPNGRRLIDDVVDITLRVAVGGVLDPSFQGYTPGINDRLGDGVNRNDARNQAGFPFAPMAPSGRDRRHIDPGEPGGGPID